MKLSRFAVRLAAMRSLLFGCDLLKVSVEPVEARFPDLPVAFRPGGNLPQAAALDAAVAELCLPAACDQAGAFEHAQMLRNGRHAHLEWRRQLGDGTLAGEEPGKNRA